MTLYRAPGTIDALLLKTIGELSPAVVKNATGKAHDTFNKISRDTNDMGLHLIDAIKLDMALMENGKPSVFHDHFTEQINKAFKPIFSIEVSVPEQMMKIMKEVGDVASACTAATDHNSAGGKGLTNNERREIIKQAHEAQEQLKALIKAVEIKTPENKNSETKRPIDMCGRIGKLTSVCP